MAKLPARIRVNATFPFPSLVKANGPVQIGKASGIWTIGLDPAFVAEAIAGGGGGGANPHLIVGTTRIDNGTDGLLLYDNNGVLGEIAAGGGTIAAIDFAIFDTKALFQLSPPLPSGVNYVYVRAVSGTYPAAAGLEPTSLTYKKVIATLGLYGEVTLGGTQIWSPVYDRSPVDAGQFGLVPDGSTTQNGAGGHRSGIATNGSNTITGIGTTGGIGVGWKFAVQNYATMGSLLAPQTPTTITAVNPTSLVLSQPMLFSGPIQFVVYPLGVSGTDNWPMLQSAIDFALKMGCGEVTIPYGQYRIDDTLHIGWGDAPYELCLSGKRRSNFYGAIGHNPVIFCSKTDRPTINIQGSRKGVVSGITVIGQNWDYIVNGQAQAISCSANPNDWVAPDLVPTGTGVNSSGGIVKYAPYIGISLDAYGAWYTIKGTVANFGALPGSPSTGDAWWITTIGADLRAWDGTAWALIPHYPARTLSSFAVSVGAQAYANSTVVNSSSVEIEENDVIGFCVGYLNQPNSDSNGDFTNVRENYFVANTYHIAICNTQSRNVDIDNNNTQWAHTFLTNAHFGFNTGGIYGHITNNHGAQQYQCFDIAMQQAGSVNVSGHYVEDGVRLGDFMGGGAFGAPLTVKYSLFGFADIGGGAGTIPASFMSAQCYTLLEGVTVVGYSRLSILNDQQGFVKIIGGAWQAAFIANALRDPSMQLGVNFTGGLLAGPCRFSTGGDRTFYVEGMNGTYYVFPASPISAIAHDDIMNRSIARDRRSMSQWSTQYQDSTGKRWRITLPTEFSFQMDNTSAKNVLYPGNADVMTFGYANSFQVSGVPFKIEVGDILYYADPGNSKTTSTLFCVSAVGAANSHSSGFTLITALQQNNMLTDRATGNFVSNANPQPTMAIGNILIIKTQVIIPSQLSYGTFALGNANVTNIHRGDQNGNNFAFYYNNGDELNGPPAGTWNMNTVNTNEYPIPTTGATLSAVTAGTGGTVGGTATLSFAAVASGIFPFFPYQLR